MTIIPTLVERTPVNLRIAEVLKIDINQIYSIHFYTSFIIVKYYNGITIVMATLNKWIELIYRDGPYFIIWLPLDKNDDGPASYPEAERTIYEVWDCTNQSVGAFLTYGEADRFLKEIGQ